MSHRFPLGKPDFTDFEPEWVCSPRRCLASLKVAARVRAVNAQSRSFLVFWIACLLAPLSAAPPDLRPQEGLRENPSQSHALKGARVVVRPGDVLENGTIIVRDGRIEAVGIDLPVPADARVWNLEGKTLYPGFIDPYATFGQTKAPEKPVDAATWHPQIHAAEAVLDHVRVSAEDLKKRRELGFTSAHLVPTNGIFRGRGALLQMTDPQEPTFVLQREVGQHLAFVTGSDYPKSLMGCLALIRQTLSDARWYQAYRQAYRQRRHETRPGEREALTALGPVVTKRRVPAYFRIGNEADIDRALSLSQEFKLRRILVDSGHGYRRWQRLKRSGTDLILPLRFPETPAVEDPDRALDVSLAHLQHWEQAPAGPALLERQGIPFALSTHQLDDQLQSFWPNVRKAVKRGLSEETALKALTQHPARLLGESERLGAIEYGRLANLVVAEGNLFRDKDAKILQVWIEGHPWHDTLEESTTSAAGHWRTAWTGVEGPESFQLRQDGKKLSVELGGDETEEPTKAEVKRPGRNELLFTLPATLFGASEGKVRLSAYQNIQTIVGQGVLPDGSRFTWSARRDGEIPITNTETKTVEKSEPSTAEMSPFEQYPAGAFPGRGPGMNPLKRRVFIKNATVWTCGPQGVLQNANVVIDEGRIVAVGRDIQPSKRSHVIDGTGKHVTPGLIDCHSHTAINRGVNEGSHAVTCEVRIGDVLDPTDINLYRQLAGGLTVANLLHGSANPMGGQNQVIKLRWGQNADGLKFKGAKPGVKFALGENVKQANWGDRFTTRYPQSRMGVEQLMRDTFLAAREYGARKQLHTEQEKAMPFRTDYRMEAVLEILRGERLVHIHSYRQDEILMFVRLAQEFGFTVGTFQHVLEGYKVPEAIAEINAGASSFSDWWAYKFEVYDAIPHNGALLHQAGVLTSFNSDDAELATRLNTEAAKAVKYGGVPPEEALKFVTLNPAQQLRIAHRVGSLEAGKDADFVIWSGPPLSTLSRCEETWIEGTRYFHQTSHRERMVWVERERRRLIHQILTENDTPSKDEKASEGKEKEKGDEAPMDLARRLRLLSPWGQYEQIDHQALYHDGQSLHVCTGCYCDFR